MARGSQPENGSSALLPATAMMRRMAITVASVPPSATPGAGVPPNNSDRLAVPAAW